MLKKLALAATFIAVLPHQAAAMTHEEVVALVTMPLAVSAAIDVTGIPVPRLINVVTMMNEAEVPPPQFVQIVRYMPATLVTDDNGDRFVQYVQTRHDQGVTGAAFVTAIDEDLPSYGIPAVDLNVYQPPPDVIYTDNEEEFFPVIVRTHVVNYWGYHHWAGRPFITFRPMPVIVRNSPIFFAVPRPAYFRPGVGQWAHPVAFVPGPRFVPVPGPRFVPVPGPRFVPVPVPHPFVPVPGPRAFAPHPVVVAPPHPFVPTPSGGHPVEHFQQPVSTFHPPQPVSHTPTPPPPQQHFQQPVSTFHPSQPAVHTPPPPPPHQSTPENSTQRRESVHTQVTKPATQSIPKNPKDKGKG